METVVEARRMLLEPLWRPLDTGNRFDVPRVPRLCGLRPDNLKKLKAENTRKYARLAMFGVFHACLSRGE